ncbi:MAG TPA: aspartate/glutamate racemase family protein [Burkholderiales bacterium]|nr:aspartate/glutamate racemase family protein [Burkholderiales bacterium]
MKHVEKKHRLGLLVPSSNSTQEPEFLQMLPASVSLHVARLTLSRIDPDATLEIVAELDKESRKLADAAVDLLVFAATAPSTRMGKGYDAKLIKRMEDASGKPATTAATAMLDAFAALGVRRVALAAPWSETTNQWVAGFLESHGIDVVSRVAMGVVSNNEVGRLHPDSAFEQGRKADRKDADAVFLACGNWWTASIVEPLEQAIGKPVLTTNNMTVWHALAKMGAHGVPGFGQLLRDMPALRKAA